MNLAVSTSYRVKIKENEKRDKYFDLAWELKKVIEHESDGNINYSRCTRNGPQRLRNGTRGAGNRRTNRDPANYGIINIGQNTKKNPGDLRRLAIIQTPMKDNQVTQAQINSQGAMIEINTAARNSNGSINTNKKLENRNGKKNNYTDSSSKKLSEISLKRNSKKS